MPESRTTVVVNMFGGPGAGKTTAAWEIASELKKRGYITEYVPEYAKELVWEGKTDLLDGTPEHQEELLKEQRHRIERLNGKVDFIVTDAPLMQNPLYLKTSSLEISEFYTHKVYNYYSRYENFNVFIQRSEKFEQAGRIHSLDQSREIDKQIHSLLDKFQIYYGTYKHETVSLIARNCITTYKRVQFVPLYTRSYELAQIYGEIKEWNESFIKNCQCCDAIERAIEENIIDGELDNCAGKIIDTYGIDRVRWVLANTVQQRDRYEVGFSEGVRVWADEFFIYPHVDNDRFSITAPARLVEEFVGQVDDYEAERAINAHEAQIMDGSRTALQHKHDAPQQ